MATQLVPLPEVERLSASVVRILGGNPGKLDEIRTHVNLNLHIVYTAGVEGATLKAFHTPGHTVDHMIFVLEEEDAIFTGDNVLGHGTAVFEDLKVYLSSLQRMQDRVSGRGYPGHGAVIDNATAKITEYIKHRQQREDEVIRVLRYGKLDVPDDEPSPERKASWTPLEIVKVIYHNVPESLHLPASHGVLQVLMKLEAEGKTIHDTESGKWRLETGKSAL
ncbi:unnamed protein product [Aspergillus oryzae RIB40]|uniref:DNA, SC003 n=1 Tax=Aspergillus oryzae (strain ATCC 42149 / RIB 40) TaxID=510516 RepID=Q2ULG9_ASPOR|nr:unnamed protein product [Aspergillus oryzae RIB40]BAE57596.1 unnamed protein product [Aspergillus oryzae RIB40]